MSQIVKQRHRFSCKILACGYEQPTAQYKVRDVNKDMASFARPVHCRGDKRPNNAALIHLTLERLVIRFWSKNFAQGSFPAEGYTEYLGTAGCMRTSLLVGPLNVEAMRANDNARSAYFTANPPVQPYVILTVCFFSIVASPDTLAEQHRCLQRFVGEYQPPVAVAWVADGEVEGFRLMEETHVRIFASAGIPLRLFRHKTEAESWLKEQLQASLCLLD